MQQTEDGRPTDTEGEAGPKARDAQEREPGTAEILAALEDNYRAVQYHYVQFLAEHLTDCRRSLGGDLDEMMILAVLGQRLIGARLARDGGDDSAQDRVWMSALRIADVTGVPRESVRRKLQRLKERGWVSQDPTDGWRLAGTLDALTVRSDLTELDRRAIGRLARLIKALLPVLETARTRESPTKTAQS